MTRRLLLIAFALNLTVAAITSWAQQPNKVPVVGVLMAISTPGDPIVEALRQGLGDLGYVDGRTVKIEFRTALGHADRLPSLAEELVRLKVDVIFAVATPAMLAIELVFVRASTPEEFDAAFTAARRARAQALYVSEGPLFYVHRATLTQLASKARLPAIYRTRVFAEAGGLMSYGASWLDQARRAAGYIDKIVKGAKPSDLPIEQPTKFELVVNLHTAKALGIKIPKSILLRADEVIR